MKHSRLALGLSLAAALAACSGHDGAKKSHAENQHTEHGAGDAHAAPAEHGASAHDTHGGLGPASAHAAPHAVAPHWSYRDQAAWAHFVSGGDACATGREQSPINLSSASPVAELPDIAPRYLRTAGAFLNNGHTLQFAPAQDNLMLTIGQDLYPLVQLHFHSPAEHTLDRRAYPVEIHFVHRNSLGQLAVLGVFVEEGDRNEALAQLLAATPAGEGEANAARLTLDPAGLLPADRTYYAYAGSLTTPPCTEGVRWNVLRTPITASAEQIAALREALGATSRPVQPLNGRTLLLGL